MNKLIIISFFIILAVSLWLILSPSRSIVTVLDDYNIEMIIKDTKATAVFADNQVNIKVYQQANSELQFLLDFNSIANILIFHGEDNFIGQRTIVFDEVFTISPTGQNEVYTFIITPRDTGENTLLIQPNRTKDLNNGIKFESPSCLQMALFAHMAYFPFDINNGKPQDFNPFHYEPFYEHVISYNSWGLNSFGFNFVNEMSEWDLFDIYDDKNTDFRVVLYKKEDKLVLSIRGSYGGIIESLSTQTGTWWYNFLSLSGHRHLHLDSLKDFLYKPETIEMLENSKLYITGHSLGGYLAYFTAYELSQMGLEDNIKRVIAFSTPIFYNETINILNSLDNKTIQKISHFHVNNDLIAGIIGIDRDFPDYGTFALISRLFKNMRENRGVDIPISLQILSDGIRLVEGFSQSSIVPLHIRELLWTLNGAFEIEANILIEEFNNIIWHESINQNWYSPRPLPNIPLIPSALEELVVDVVFDFIDRIFDTDAHVMMNFYNHLAVQAINY